MKVEIVIADYVRVFEEGVSTDKRRLREHFRATFTVSSEAEANDLIDFAESGFETNAESQQAPKYHTGLRIIFHDIRDVYVFHSEPKITAKVIE